MNATIEIPPLTPAQLAGLFWEMDAKAQGLFFDELGQHAITTPAPFTREIGSMSPLDWQMFVASAHATPLGRDAMARVCENGIKLLKPCGVTDIDIITQLGDRCMELNNERAELRSVKAAYEAEKAAHLSARECLAAKDAEAKEYLGRAHMAEKHEGMAGVHAAASLLQASEANKELQKLKNAAIWHRIEDGLPAPGRRVLVQFTTANGARQITIGEHLTDKFRDASTCCDDCEEWAYEDENGDFWWPAGWWESVRFDDQVSPIHEVTHWRPLPSVAAADHIGESTDTQGGAAK